MAVPISQFDVYFLDQYVFPWELPLFFDNSAEQTCQASSIHALLEFFFVNMLIHR